MSTLADFDFKTGAGMVGILFMSCIGLLILFISVSNFVVLFMVQGERRSKEIPFGYEIKYIYRVGVLVWIALLVCISSWKTIIRNPFEALKVRE